MKKLYLYKTAFWAATGQYVKLVKYHKIGNYFDIETSIGEKGCAQFCELSRFCL